VITRGWVRMAIEIQNYKMCNTLCGMALADSHGEITRAIYLDDPTTHREQTHTNEMIHRH